MGRSLARQDGMAADVAGPAGYQHWGIFHNDLAPIIAAGMRDFQSAAATECDTAPEGNTARYGPGKSSRGPIFSQSPQGYSRSIPSDLLRYRSNIHRTLFDL